MCHLQISSIMVDCYERWAHVIHLETGQKLMVHFYQFDEFLIDGLSDKVKVGDVLEGELCIWLVNGFVETQEVSGFNQFPHNVNSASILAVIESIESLGSDCVCASIMGLSHKITIRFEHEVSMKTDCSYLIRGELHFEPKKREDYPPAEAVEKVENQ